jgi:hypothetical protein
MKKQISDKDRNAINENRNPGTRFCFVPRRLEINEFPKFNNFPFNIMFMSSANIDGIDTSGTAIYYPDFSTFKEQEDSQFMIYYNQYDDSKDWKVVIVYDKKNKLWKGLKYNKDEYKGEGGGSDWKMFFVHLTALGVIKGERVKFDEI